jgi:hypothetical protein
MIQEVEYAKAASKHKMLFALLVMDQSLVNALVVIMI